MLRMLRRSEEGATAIEYGLIVALLAVACIGAMRSMGGGSDGMWTRISNQVEQAM
jgi:pilus assembly protein Flp/PilA